MDKKSPEINKPVSAGRSDLRVSVDSVGRKNLKIEFLLIFLIYSIFKNSIFFKSNFLIKISIFKLSAARRDRFGIISGFTSM
jgi:hypothetical protein